MSNDAKREAPRRSSSLTARNKVLKSKLDEALAECANLTTMRDAYRVRVNLERDRANILRVDILALQLKIGRLQQENARLRAAVEAAGGLCTCGHLQHSHDLEKYLYRTDCLVAQCPCYHFTPASQAPAEGKGEGER